jgi:cobaltochelatase CobN
MEGVVIVDQTAAPIIFLTAADTDIQAIANVFQQLPADFPGLRVCNLLNLQQSFSIDDYGDRILGQAQVIVVRLLGGRSYWPYGLEMLGELAEEKPEIKLFILPGDDRPDLTLMEQSTVPLSAVHHLWQYFAQGGVANIRHGLMWLGNYGFGRDYQWLPPQPVPKVGIYSSYSGLH